MNTCKDIAHAPHDRTPPRVSRQEFLATSGDAGAALEEPVDCDTRESDTGLAEGMCPEWVAKRFHLTPRESQVLRGIMDDLTDAGIAARLKIAKPTVRTYLKAISRKLPGQPRSRVAMVMTMMREMLKG